MKRTKKLENLILDSIMYNMHNRDREMITRCIGYVRYSNSKVMKLNFNHGYMILKKDESECNIIFRYYLSRSYYSGTIDLNRFFKRLVKSL